MKKLLPYLFAVIAGCLFGLFIFNYQDKSILTFKESISVTGFQLGVFNSLDLAKEYSNKYPSSIIVIDEDVYRVYISILSLNDTIKRMEKYLNNHNIAFYKKDITISDKGLIKALNNYEKSMLEGNDNTFFSINKLIMESYGGEV